ncbi:MAG: hypothetical protein HZA89_04420 [Verrucomicrobia bacterium]|nr:hypothetical protein [Verrucomicrobiota bacterium]
MLIGDKTGPAIIAHTYGDVRPDHLLKQAQRIRLTATQPGQQPTVPSSIKSSNTVPEVATGFSAFTPGSPMLETIENKGDF